MEGKKIRADTWQESRDVPAGEAKGNNMYVGVGGVFRREDWIVTAGVE